MRRRLLVLGMLLLLMLIGMILWSRSANPTHTQPTTAQAPSAPAPEPPPFQVIPPPASATSPSSATTLTVVTRTLSNHDTPTQDDSDHDADMQDAFARRYWGRTLAELEADRAKARTAAAELAERIAGAQLLARLATHNATAARMRDKLLRSEADPRVRATLAQDPSAQEPDAAPVTQQQLASPVYLPQPASPAMATTLDVAWNSSREGAYRTQVTIQPDGRAMVETTGNQGHHVRFPGWAWRDAAGNTIIDVRGAPVTYLDNNNTADGNRTLRNGYLWSPDSMIIQTNGQVRFEDDANRVGSGQLPVAGSEYLE